MTEQITGHRRLYEIALEIARDWGDRLNFGAKPYLEAMFKLNEVTDRIGMDDGRTVIQYFLTNAGTWRGPVAKRVKAELRGML